MATSGNRVVENKTGTELEILKNIEKAFYKNNQDSAARNTNRSLKWFMRYVPRSYNRVRTSQLMRDASLHQEIVRPGNMYFFVYDAKHKDTLPVWDAFPLIFPFEVFTTKRGDQAMLGINLHYLPPRLRFEAMKALLKLRNEKRYRSSTRLKISWDVLKALSTSKLYKHSVKMYLMKHVRSRFIKIPAQSWELAIYLPVARWMKGSQQDAWKFKD